MTSTDLRVDIEEVRTKQDRLAAARAMLHTHFVGIDAVIDELCDAIAVWYLMPEVLSRPLVVNLWGMTGVGKTDLVRRLVAALGLQERFVELELSSTDAQSRFDLVADRLADAGVLDGRPAVLLVDEIQRFRTITPSGDPVAQTRFSDFWELLSDGRLARRESSDLDWLIATMRAARDEDARREGKGKSKGKRPSIGLWEARSLRRTLGLAEPVEQLQWRTHDEALAMLESARAERRLVEPVDCSRFLVIVSGNLDEAFTMASATGEADIDADIFAAHTARVGMVDIKAALRQRFTPEQVARFGNVHVIYQSLRRADFQTLVAREIARLCDAAYRRFGVRVAVTPAVHELVYRNGVFPVQGVRPVLSSVGDIVGTPLATLLMDAVLGGHPDVGLDHDGRTGDVVGEVGGRETRFGAVGRIDRFRGQAHADVIANVAVHEAGHAVAYAVLFGLVPLQLTAHATGDADGFLCAHDVHQTRDSMLRMATVALAGGLAEELIFGAEHASAGRASDRERATSLVLDSVRRLGFGSWALDYGLEFAYATDASVTDPTAEALLASLADRAAELLRAHRGA
ncbi:MAG: AAA family ATPase, partial [Dermatophilaceae bacterium]|nr:AAA family ATPase [Dermatophilaceae bacterium]